MAGARVALLSGCGIDTRLQESRNCRACSYVIQHHAKDGLVMLKVIGWIVGILVLIGLLVVVGVFDLIF